MYLRHLGVVLIVTAAFGATAYADSVEAYSGVVAGTPVGCAGGGAPAAMYAFFGNQGFGIGNVGNGISSCGLSGGVNDVVQAAGTAVSTSSLPLANYYSNEPGSTYTGSGSATTEYGVISADALGTLNGYEGSTGFAESVAYGIATDTLSFAPNGSGNGTSGFVSFALTMNGTYSMTSTLFPTTPLGTAYAELGVQVGSSGVNDVFYAPDSEGTVTINAGAIPAGCVIGTATFTCTNAVVHTIMFPVVFNTATTVKVGLTEVASAFETVTIDPFLGGDLTGITLYNAGGQQITGGFSITSGSGAVYDADGIVSQPASASVPEPSSAMLLAFMVLGVAAIVGKRIAVRI